MTIAIHISDGPVPALGRTLVEAGDGAVLVFEGIVRPLEHGRTIRSLFYQAYEPMAQNQMQAIARDLIARHGITSIEIWHSRGRVPVGACSFRLVVTSPHRKEALRAADEFIDRLKQDVPIWKQADASPGHAQ